MKYLLIISLMLTACAKNGSDGSTGAQGIAGPPGPTGPIGPNDSNPAMVQLCQGKHTSYALCINNSLYAVLGDNSLQLLPPGEYHDKDCSFTVIEGCEISIEHKDE